MRKRNFLFLALFSIASAILYYLLSTSPIDAVAYQPPPGPTLEGPTTPNALLKKAELLGLGAVYGPEDVDVDAQGRVYGGTQDGKIIRILANGETEIFCVTGGRPLGLHFDAGGNLIVADAWKGLLSIDPQGTITTLLTEAEGVPFAFTDDLDISQDGTIYFSDASAKFNQPDYMLDALEARPHGRLIRYRPDSKEVTVLLRDLYFANGIALSKNEDFLLVNETWKYRILRYWLQGEKQGQHDVFIDNLPGFPDGISANRQGLFWLALPTLRNAQLDKMHPRPWLKNFVAKLPPFFSPKPIPYGLVLALDEQGNIVKSLHDTDGTHLREITSVQQHGDALYFGTLSNDRIGRLALQAL